MFCSTCNITIKRKTNYKRHLVTTLHIENEKKGVIAAKRILLLYSKEEEK